MPYENDLKTHFEEYEKECQYSSCLRIETVRGYTAVFRLFMSVMPEITEARHLTPEMLSEFFKRLHTRERTVGRGILKMGVKNSTIKTYWSKLNSFFEWLARKEILKVNPLKRIRPPEPTYQDQRAIANEDIRKLYSAIILHSQTALALRRDTAMISLLHFCGLRLNEFISLEVRDIDFEKQLLTVRGETSKSARIRLIPIHTTLLFHLRDYIAERNKRGYKTHFLIVATGNDRRLSRHGLKHWVESLSKKSGVKFHLHKFRHAFACNLAIKDVNAVKIQKLLGHKSLEMTMSYLRSIRTEDLNSEINRLSI